jgi:hypothetical protein
VTKTGGHLGWISQAGGYFGEPWTDKVIVEWLLSVQVQLRQAKSHAIDCNNSPSSNGSTAQGVTPRLKSAAAEHSGIGATDESLAEDAFDSPCLATSTLGLSESLARLEPIDNGNGKDSKNGQGQVLKCYSKALPPGALRSVQHGMKFAQIGATLSSLHRGCSTQAAPLFVEHAVQPRLVHAREKKINPEQAECLAAVPNHRQVSRSEEPVVQEPVHTAGEDAIVSARVVLDATPVARDHNKAAIASSETTSVTACSSVKHGRPQEVQPSPAKAPGSHERAPMFWNESSMLPGESGSNRQGQPLPHTSQALVTRRDSRANSGTEPADAKVVKDTCTAPQSREEVPDTSEEETSPGVSESLLYYTAMLVCKGTELMPSPAGVSEASTSEKAALKPNKGMYGSAATRSPDAARFQLVGSSTSRPSGLDVESGEHG